MKQLFLLLTGLLLFSGANAQQDHGRVKPSADGHFLQYEDGTPFFWLGDTAWELFHRLTLPEIQQYLDNRAAKGFNVIQAVALAEMDGLRKPNRYGQTPFIDLDPNQPNERYFALIDSTIRMAADRHLFIGLLPTWGDKVTKAWGEGPVVFDTANAYRYGKRIAKRYKAAKNIIWILGGDRPAISEKADWRPIWRAMAKGIKEGSGNKCLIAYHPSGGSNSTSQWLQQEKWLDVNMFQSGHGGGHDTPCWELVKRDWQLSPIKPTLDAEPNYEDHPVNPWPKWNTDSGYFRAYDVRKQIYRSVFAGACGVTYGHHAVWQFMSAVEEAINYPDRGWINALDRPGAFQAGYLRRLMEWKALSNRQPDSTIISGNAGEKGEHIEAFRTADHHVAMVYLPVGKTLTLREGIIPVRAAWYNPRDGSRRAIQRMGSSFTPPTLGAGNDWVLVITDNNSAFTSWLYGF